MSNDRVYIICTGCGAWRVLLKFWPGGFTHREDNDVLAWAGRHGACHPHRYAPWLKGDPGFRLATMAEELDLALQNAEPPSP